MLPSNIILSLKCLRLSGKEPMQMHYNCQRLSTFVDTLVVLHPNDTALLSSTLPTIVKFFASMSSLHYSNAYLSSGHYRSSQCNRYVEQARCLSFIWDAYHGENLKWRAIFAALQELNRAESADDDLQEVCRFKR